MIDSKHFAEWLKEKGITLVPWQWEAADALLSVVSEHQGAASGKTFLMQTVSRFIEDEGRFLRRFHEERKHRV